MRISTLSKLVFRIGIQENESGMVFENISLLIFRHDRICLKPFLETIVLKNANNGYGEGKHTVRMPPRPAS
jgi:hypothetical protein